tara:strand:+ start:236 stop:622 length:387 start_codon:yes stop_codon:yes gene_type:complete
MDSDQEKIIANFLNVCGVPCESMALLDGLVIPRETLLLEERYKSACQHIERLKEIYSSSYMTSLQKTAKSTQAWPLINIVRQVLKSCGFFMAPKRLSNGYTKSGKKLYKRVFIITRPTLIMSPIVEDE